MAFLKIRTDNNLIFLWMLCILSGAAYDWFRQGEEQAPFDFFKASTSKTNMSLKIVVLHS